MYQLFCDSNCELWHTTVKELGLNLIRMPYIVDGEEYFYDMGENTDFKKFFDGMKAGGTPTTAALNEYAYTVKKARVLLKLIRQRAYIVAGIGKLFGMKALVGRHYF